MEIRHGDCPGHQRWQVGSIFECLWRHPGDLRGIESAEILLANSLRDARVIEEVELPEGSHLNFMDVIPVDPDQARLYAHAPERLPVVWHWQCGRPGLYVKKATLRQTPNGWIVGIEAGVRGMAEA